MYLNLIIKGNKFQAARAGADHGVPVVFLRETKHGETVGRTHDSNLPAVRAWFDEHPSGPQPIGALLSWAEIDRVSPDGTPCTF